MMVVEYRRHRGAMQLRNMVAFMLTAPGQTCVASVGSPVMKRLAWLLPIVFAIGTPAAARAQAPAGRQAFLLLVDDLHLDFRQTPRTRKQLHDLLRELGPDGGVWAVVTTGTSSIWIAPTTDLAEIDAAISRVTGNALKPGDHLAAVSGSATVVAELRHRAEVAYSAVVDAIGRVASAPNHGPITVLYLSRGYDTRVVPPPTNVIEAAAHAGAAGLPMRPADLDPDFNLPTGLERDAWAAYTTVTREALQTLAGVGGQPVLQLPDPGAEPRR